MDPTRTSRRTFTSSLTSHPVPDDADPQYKSLAEALRRLLTLLINHPAMSKNIDQTYSTPAASKNKVYFMWDFVGRTLAMLFGLPPSMPGRPAPPPQTISTPEGAEAWKEKQKQGWTEVMQRALYARELILDEGGKLDAMMNVSYGDGSGVEKADFGDEVLNASRAIMEHDRGNV
ncbi:hypothetical protein, variant 2 [Verruconis gallopava]|uniref:Uncharacterized protein n=1 Tax=Verruconis gallopava TaxID=253628 RepID=A0A0D2AZA9_9PEZI|nr:uncharacterized protein PV09_04723 [Verruconis gallopava]XP_016214328.1 hypothetical protein, variant 1 [Verruconis gallopava]XP_016214329.1 hypothetical protein, variant 2 [Verruconis gallopava]KIW04458.1 hypothetical protein PV09_04723 [Verruconis gallopava]KIW04459.1 hypothetical protein, variant 1 [Verruconis gallopava]KIW04460.1 hypothetical protein, variant 2 [Verruconis gallopava]